MATVNMLYTCTAGYKNEKPNDDDDDDGDVDGGGFLLSTLSAIDMPFGFLGYQQYFFIFFLDNDDIFIYVSFSLLIFEHTPHNNIVFIFGFCYFSLRSFLFIVENQLSFGIFDWLVGRSLGFTLIETMPMCVLHTMLKSYFKPYHFGEEN